MSHLLTVKANNCFIFFVQNGSFIHKIIFQEFTLCYPNSIIRYAFVSFIKMKEKQEFEKIRADALVRQEQVTSS